MNQLPLQRGLDAMFWFNLLAMAGAALGGFLVTRFGSRRLLLAVSALAGVGVLVLMQGMGPAGAASVPLLDLGVALVGGATAMLLATMYVVLAYGYPVARRASGVGVSMLLGRFGGIASSWFGGQLLGAAVADSAPFYLSLLLAVAGIVAGLLIIDRHVPGDRT
jgi:MFS family permease